VRGKPRKRRVGRVIAEPLLARVLMNPAAVPPMNSKRYRVITGPAGL